MNWTQAPDWAQFYTVDERGAAYWWEDEPYYSMGDARWKCLTGRTQRADNITSDAKQILERRKAVAA